MPFNDSYSTLQTAVRRWAQRSTSEAELIASIPDFILLAEIRLNRNLFIDSMLQLTTLSTVVANDLVSHPSGYKKARSLKISSVDPIISIKYRTPQQLDSIPGLSRQGQPLFYTDVGSSFQFGPVPNNVYDIELWYWKKFDVLSGSNTTNWWLTDAPDALLFGSLLEMAPYLKDPEDLAIWEARFNRAMEELTGAADDALYGGELVMESDYNTSEPAR